MMLAQDVAISTQLRFWQRSRQWSKEIFFLTKRSPFAADKRLTAQINDSSESVMANIAEGFGRGTHPKTNLGSCFRKARRFAK